MTESITRESARTTHQTEHEITVDAPAERVYELIADVETWAHMFDPTVHAVSFEQDGMDERIRIWASANGAAKTWTSRRHRDPDALTITFRQEKSQPPVGGMGGTWAIEPTTESTCRVRLLHDYFAATDDPADVEWIAKAVDHNSTVELQKLKARAEEIGSPMLLTFADTVEVNGTAKDVYDFINEAQLWKERLPHVARVSLEEDTPGLQILEMDTRTKDGSVHTTRSIRVCEPYGRIIYKQIVLPALMSLHTGRWLIEEQGDGRVSVTSEHTVRINEERITSVLGPDADLAAAQKFVQGALSGNSLATLKLAKAYAENAAGGER